WTRTSQGEPGAGVRVGGGLPEGRCVTRTIPRSGTCERFRIRPAEPSLPETDNCYGERICAARFSSESWPRRPGVFSARSSVISASYAEFAPALSSSERAARVTLESTCPRTPLLVETDESA